MAARSASTATPGASVGRGDQVDDAARLRADQPAGAVVGARPRVAAAVPGTRRDRDGARRARRPSRNVNRALRSASGPDARQLAQRFR